MVFLLLLNGIYKDNKMKNLGFFISFDKIYIFFIVLFSFFLPISYKLTIYLFAIVVLVWVLSRNWYRNKRYLYGYNSIFLLIIFWVLHLFSIIYSQNINKVFYDVIQKISFLLFPLIFLTSNSILKYRRIILDTFLLSLIFIAFFLLVKAFNNSFSFKDFSFTAEPIETPWENNFLYSRFTEPYHPSYLSLYFSFGLAILTNRFMEASKILYKVILLFLFLFFLIIIYLSSSKAGLLVAYIIFLLSLFWFLVKKSRLFAILIVIMFSTVLMILVMKNSRFSNFISSISGSKNHELIFENKEFEKKLRSEANVRLDIWTSIPSIVGNNWLFGVGVGDTKKILVEGYRERGILYAVDTKLNTHNQFLETFVGLGLVGLTLLVIILSVGFWQAFQRRDMLLFMFLLIISINFLFESMFERVFGVMFFSFFYSLLLIRHKAEED